MVRRSYQQLALALPGYSQAIEPILTPTPRAAKRMRHARTGGDRSRARARATAEAARVRTMPTRDSRGRFVSFPTIDAPSWYVFCADGYRIPGEPGPEAITPSAPAAPQPLPRAVARSRRRTPRARLTRADLLTYLAFVVGYIAVLWYGLHLPRPYR